MTIKEKVLLLNDTSAYHNGTKVVISELRKRFGFQDSVPTGGDVSAVDLAPYDHVVLNGEGTMHHAAKNALKFLGKLREAKDKGCRVSIINSVWQAMPNDYDDLLRRCHLLEVREKKSASELSSKHGVTHHTVRPDASYFRQVPWRKFDREKVYVGQFWDAKNADHANQVLARFGIRDSPRISIFDMSWDEVVNRLRCADLLVTGRFHELIAASVARCRVLLYEGSTWKNQAMFSSAGVEPPLMGSKSASVLETIKGYQDRAVYDPYWRWLETFRPAVDPPKIKRSNFLLWLKGKRIAVVGNGSSHMNRNCGQAIDSHDVVMRFNSFETLGMEADVGSRCDVWVHCAHENMKYRPEEFTLQWLPTHSDIRRGPLTNSSPFVLGSKRQEEKLYGICGRPSTGLMAVNWLKEAGLTATIYNFDHFSAGHYYDQYENVYHDSSVEEEFFRRYLLGGNISIG